MIAIDHILVKDRVRPLNKSHVEELALSFKEGATKESERAGMLAPIQVFRLPQPKDGKHFILADGSHRLAAAQSLGWKVIEANCIGEYENDEQVRAAQATGNIQRENMTALQEAEAIEKMIEDAGNDADAIEVVSRKLGRGIQWINNRLSLLSLTEKAREALSVGDIPLSHAYKLATVGDPKVQDEILKRIRGHKGTTWSRGGNVSTYFPPMEIHHVNEIIGEIHNSLKDVPWDKTFVWGKHGACSNCPNNSENRGELFGHAKGHTCLDAGCYQEKLREANSGARKCATWLRNAELPVTQENVAKAKEARDVKFVSPVAVVESVKRAAQLAKKRKNSSGKTAAGAGGEKPAKRGQWEVEHKIDSELRDQMRSWNGKRLEACVDVLVKSQLSAAYLLLLDFSGALNDAKNKAAVVALLKVAANPTADDLARVARGIQFPKTKLRWGTRLYQLIDGWDDDFNGELFEALRIDQQQFGAKPTREAVKAKLFPKVEKKPEPKKADKKVPAKPTKKKSKK